MRIRLTSARPPPAKANQPPHDPLTPSLLSLCSTLTATTPCCVITVCVCVGGVGWGGGGGGGVQAGEWRKQGGLGVIPSPKSHELQCNELQWRVRNTA